MSLPFNFFSCSRSPCVVAWKPRTYTATAAKEPPKKFKVYVDEKLVLADPGTTVLQVRQFKQTGFDAVTDTA